MFSFSVVMKLLHPGKNFHSNWYFSPLLVLPIGRLNLIVSNFSSKAISCPQRMPAQAISLKAARQKA